MKRIRHQILPSAGPEREALRQKGQFWTPDWVAEAMISYAVGGGSHHVFDPAVGAGAFFRAAKNVASESGSYLKLLGTEIDDGALQEARRNGLSSDDLSRVQVGDFVLRPPQEKFDAIVGNPPYIRHHRLPAHVKVELKRFAAGLVGTPLDGRAGLHVYFLLRALQLLSDGGRLAFIVPADTCEGVFSTILWKWVTREYRLDAVVTFAPEASPFPGVDTNPVIFFISNARPASEFWWARCYEPETAQLKMWVASGFKDGGATLGVFRRGLAEGLATGLSRSPVEVKSDGPVLSDYARVMRGVATGANEFFFLTVRRATELRISSEFLLPAVGRTRDVPGEEVSLETIEALEEKGKPTLLFSPDGRPLDLFPKPVRDYLKQGEAVGVHLKTLIATRRPWHKMETRPAPPFLFAYLGRRSARFIRNLAGVVPLTGFLCVYPHSRDRLLIEKLWTVLRHPETIANLSLVGKSYGSGAIKVEPRALERLQLSNVAMIESGLDSEPSNRRRVQRTEQPFLPLV
ncbi:MAG: N-6 DNA methylase [Rubrivivax sp.]|nr:N-6 DNA methylase [Pyrinomonadaceae bacterium]